MRWCADQTVVWWCAPKEHGGYLEKIGIVARGARRQLKKKSVGALVLLVLPTRRLSFGLVVVMRVGVMVMLSHLCT
jgi:hypothetical protein